MGASRVFALLTLASCAEISGLSGLGVDGGAAPDDGSFDSADDTTEPPADGGADAVSDGSADSSTTTHCQSLGFTTVFCADFDEQDVSAAFVNGQPGSWTTHSSTKPSLDTAQSTSPPQSGAFDGNVDQWLSFQPNAAFPSTTVFHLTMHVRNEAIPASGDNPIASIQVSPSYTLDFVLRVNNATSYTLQINEAVTADAGVQTTSHKPVGSEPNATWQTLDVTISNGSVMASLGQNISASFNRVQTGISMLSMMVGWAQAGWTGEVDDVVLTTN